MTLLIRRSYLELVLLGLRGRGGVQEINGENLEGEIVSIYRRNAILNDESVCVVVGFVRRAAGRRLPWCAPFPCFDILPTFDIQSDPDSIFHHSCALKSRLPSCLIYLEDYVSCESRDA